jgi:hypothetical protein
LSGCEDVTELLLVRDVAQEPAEVEREFHFRNAGGAYRTAQFGPLRWVEMRKN